MVKKLWDEQPYLDKKISKIRKRGLFQMAALFFYKNNFA